MKRFRLTTFFVITALAVLSATTVAVNLLGSRLAEENLLRVTEENTTRDAAHIQSMMWGGDSMHGMSAGASARSGAMQEMQRPVRLTLESVAGEMPRTLLGLVEGFNIVKLNLFDLDGKTVWSSDPGTLGITKRESPGYQEAVAGGAYSKLAKRHKVVDLEGVPRRIDVVETYVPL